MAVASLAREDPTPNETTVIHKRPYIINTAPPELIPMIIETEIPNQELDIQKAIPTRERMEKLRFMPWE